MSIEQALNTAIRLWSVRNSTRFMASDSGLTSASSTSRRVDTSFCPHQA